MYQFQEAIYEDGTYLRNNPTWHEEDSPWKARQIAAILRRNQVAPQTVAEIGCGAGEVLNCLARELGDSVFCTGYDVSSQAIALSRKKERANLRFHRTDPLEKPDTVFDVMMAIDVFEHVDDYYGFLRKLRKTARHTVFHIPLDLSVQSVLRAHPIQNQRDIVGHIHYFTKETALAALKDTGYEVVDHCYTHGALELANRGWKANLMKLPRKALFALQPDLAVRLLGGFSLMVLAR